MKKRYIETIKDQNVTFQGSALTVPKGTELVFVSDSGAGTPDYAVKHPEDLGANEHDSRYYYAYVPNKIVFEARLLCTPVKSKDWQESSYRWQVKIAGQSFDFYMGSGFTKPPTYDAVMSCLLSESTALEQDFAEWATELGYDSDSRKAYAIYEACVENARKLIKTGIDLDAERERLADY